jgi:hypothetical protein
MCDMALIELDHASAKIEAQLKATPEMAQESQSRFNKVQLLTRKYLPDAEGGSSDTLDLSLNPHGVK